MDDAQWTDQVILRIIWHYKLAHAVPLDGVATYDQVANASKLTKSLVVRAIRASIPLRIFDEPKPGHVGHTALSRLLATDEGFSSVIGLQVEDIGPSSARLIQAWEEFGADAGEPDQSAWSLAHGGRSLFTTLSEEPEVARRFNLAMKAVVEDKGFNMHDVYRAFDWQSIDRPGARVVDLGGGFGQVAQELAQHTEHIAFVIQDLPAVVEAGRAKLGPELQGRISFEAGDFLQPQRAASTPDAFLISRCLHNWSDLHSAAILQALKPALRKGTKILIWDVVLPDEPVKSFSDRFNLQQDFIMATIANGKDRSLSDFAEVLTMSDESFRLDRLKRLDSSKQSMIEITWVGH